MRSFWKRIGCIFIFGMLVACQQKPDIDKKLSIAVIPKGTTHVFWQSIHAGAIKSSKELGVDIIWVGPEREDDRQQQIALVDNQVINAVSGIVLAPLDEMALRRPVRAAVRRGIPVVIIDSDLKDSEDVYTSYIATDNVEGGRIAARELGRLLQGRGDVVVLRESEGAYSTESRTAGFLEAIKAFSGIDVVSSEQYGGSSRSDGQQASENLLLRFMDESGALTIDGIFCVNESTTYGMLQALRRKRLAGRVRFVGFDSSPAEIEGLGKGEIDALVVQNPFMMGYLGVQKMVSHLQGKEVEKTIDTGVHLVTQENMKDPAMEELLYPDLEKWLGSSEK